MTVLAERFGRTMSGADFRNHLGEALDTAQREPVTITNRGRARAVVVSAEFYERAIEALEDREDLLASRVSQAEDGARLSLDELRAELGIDG